MGAWIETNEWSTKPLSAEVAPPMGAWIETKRFPNFVAKSKSRAPHGRVD